MNIAKIKKYIIILIIAIILVLTTLIILLKTNTKQEVKQEYIFKEQDGVHYETIQYKKYNEIPYAYISNQQLCNIYLMDYKNNAINHPEESYEMLDKQYRELRFGNIENYKKYINDNIEKIYKIKLVKFQVTQNKSENQYICIDQYDNYYIFKETAIMQYSVILDTYTIDLPEYIQKYNSATPNQKVAMCIDKFIKNVNAGNYTLAYSMLSEGFKHTYFKTEDSFVTYVKQNLQGKAEITFGDLQTQGEIYIYNVTLTDKNNESSKISRNFNVKLGEGTKFELSFNVN